MCCTALVDGSAVSAVQGLLKYDSLYDSLVQALYMCACAHVHVVVLDQGVVKHFTTPWSILRLPGLDIREP